MSPRRRHVRALRRAVRVAAAVLSAALALAVPAASRSAGHPSQAPLGLEAVPQSKVGRVDGTRAYIAVSFDRRHVRVYVCDGTLKRRATISQWFKARWNGLEPIKLVRGGIEVRLDPVHPDGRITGALTAFSGPHRFAAETATGPAGLYDGTDRGARDTWVVPADGSLRGAIACQRPPRRRCRVVTVTLTDGTTREEVRCFEISGC